MGLVRRASRMVILLSTVVVFMGQAVFSAERPDVVWIISDDLGPELGCYGYPDVKTPNIDRLAASGTRYTRAFATAPVCSTSRTAFQVGRYQTSLNAHHHLTRDKPVLPESVPTVTDLMREAGYFVTNGRGIKSDKRKAKTHFNFEHDVETSFDGDDWSQRKAGQPFFAQVQISEPHRTFRVSDQQRGQAPIPPYLPDHPVTRADWSNYLASIEELDRKVGAVLKRLRDEGEMSSTLICFFGDHGRPHVRCKQWLYEGGLHTPLIVCWPGRVKAGSVEDGLTSLLDLMPTTLAAAGVRTPKLPGLDLLADDWKGHELIFAARDRCGDAPDRIRSVRDDRYKYIRNFHPNVPYLQHSGYKKLQYPVLTLMRVLHARGEWTSSFMAETRPPEELYDLEADPHELRNLAGDAKYREQLVVLREAMDRWIVDTGDHGSKDESATVDMDALMKEKQRYFENGMKRRGLDPNLTDVEYLSWWERQLGVVE